MLKKPILLVSSQTSGTASVSRIIGTMLGNPQLIDKVSDPFYYAGKLSEMKNYIPPTKPGKVYFWNVPQFWNTKIDLSQYRVLIHFRDPRDILCNQFFWALHHPEPSWSKEQLAAHKKKVFDQGIDNFVRGRLSTVAYDTLKQVYESAKTGERFAISYAQLCVDFDRFISTLADCLEVELTPEILKDLESERVENLLSNPKFMKLIGTWQGKDFAPGRHRDELKPETISVLDDKFADVLDFFASLEPSKLRDHYAHGRKKAEEPETK